MAHIFDRLQRSFITSSKKNSWKSLCGAKSTSMMACLFSNLNFSCCDVGIHFLAHFCHCLKSVRIRSYSGPYFQTFGKIAYWLKICQKCLLHSTLVWPSFILIVLRIQKKLSISVTSFWNLWIPQKHKNLDILRTKYYFSSNKKIH